MTHDSRATCECGPMYRLTGPGNLESRIPIGSAAVDIQVTRSDSASILPGSKATYECGPMIRLVLFSSHLPRQLNHIKSHIIESYRTISISGTPDPGWQLCRGYTCGVQRFSVHVTWLKKQHVSACPCFS